MLTRLVATAAQQIGVAEGVRLRQRRTSALHYPELVLVVIVLGGVALGIGVGLWLGDRPDRALRRLLPLPGCSSFTPAWVVLGLATR